MKAIVNTKLILEDGIIWNGAITWENGRITALGKAEEVAIPADAEIIDAEGLYTAPGLIDIHNHGGPDHLFLRDPAGFHGGGLVGLAPLEITFVRFGG